MKKSILLLLFVFSSINAQFNPAQFYNYGSGGEKDFNPNIVGYYKFDSNADDFSGLGYNGTTAGSPTYVAGKVSNAIDFNAAIGNYVNVADNNDFSFATVSNDVPFSISCWVYFSSFASIGNWIINKRDATSGGDEWHLQFGESRMSFVKYNYNNNGIAQLIRSSLNPFLINTWYHVCYTDNGTGAIGSGKLYINGSLNVDINTNSGGTYVRMNSSTSTTRIGQAAWNLSGNLHHYGRIDELGIWKNRELTASEVMELYNRGNIGETIK